MRVADDGVLSVAFDASGRLVAGGGAIGPVRVWRVADQRPAFPPLSGHTGPVTGVAFDPAGSFLATTSLLGGTRLWDPATGLGYGEELVASTRPGSLMSSVDLPPFLGLRNAFSPDGKQLAVAGVETLAMLWDVDPAVWRQRACAIVGRNLSLEEWNLYLPPGTPYRATCSEWPTGWIKRIGSGIRVLFQARAGTAEPGATSSGDYGADGLATLGDNGGSSAYLRPQRAAATCRARSGGASANQPPERAQVLPQRGHRGLHRLELARPQSTPSQPS